MTRIYFSVAHPLLILKSQHWQITWDLTFKFT